MGQQSATGYRELADLAVPALVEASRPEPAAVRLLDPAPENCVKRFIVPSLVVARQKTAGLTHYPSLTHGRLNGELGFLPTPAQAKASWVRLRFRALPEVMAPRAVSLQEPDRLTGKVAVLGVTLGRDFGSLSAAALAQSARVRPYPGVFSHSPNIHLNRCPVNHLPEAQ